MPENNKKTDDFDKSIHSYRQEKKSKLSQLSDFKKKYTPDVFLKDLVHYFDKEVDFNMDKIRQHIEKPGKLKEYIEKAKTKSTHPVIEFIHDLFKDLGESGKEKWPGELERGEFRLDD